MPSLSKTSVQFLDLWKPLEIIGIGSTCDVILVQDITTQTKKVVKLFKPEVNTSTTEAEAELILSLNHSRILRAFNYHSEVSVPSSDESTNDSSNSLPALVLEHVSNGDLLGLIQTFGKFPEIIARSYFHQLIDAIEYLHDQGVCHLDIKPDNILVDENYGIKLADFGVAIKNPEDSLLKGSVGTLIYHAPEIHSKKLYSGYQADLFALGVTLFTMVTGSMPFNSAEEGDPIYDLIRQGDFDQFWAIHEEMRSSNASSFSKNFRSLIESMLAFNIEKRLSLEQIRRHPWFQSVAPSDRQLASFVKSILVKSKCAEEVKVPKTLCKENDQLISSC